MRPDRMADRIKTPSRKLHGKAAIEKMVDLINIYHSIDARYGTPEQKREAKSLIERELRGLKGRIGTGLGSNYKWYLLDAEAWHTARDSFLR